MGYSIRSSKWRYTLWRRKNGQVIARELYDHSHSDVATKNVAELAENEDTVKQLDKLLLEIVGK